MGRLLAWTLHQAGFQVTVFDQNDGEHNCSAAAAGMLAPGSELDRAESIIFELGQDSLQQHWRRIIATLPKGLAFQHAGSLVVHHPRDHAEWQAFHQRLETKLSSAPPYYHALAYEELRKLEPELTHFDQAYYFPEEGQVDAQAILVELKNYLENAGVRFQFNTPIISLQPGKVESADRIYPFDTVLDCRGLGAKSVFPELRSLRGELLWVQAPDVKLNRPIRLLHPRYRLYIVPRPHHVYLIGATEIEAEDSSPISVRSTLELLTAAYFVHPGFAEARIIKTVTHCRPTLPNHLPCIRYQSGLLAINGLYRHGYLMGPALAQDILCHLQQRPVSYPQLWRKDDACIRE